MNEQEWLILSVTLPKNPSRVRVGVWRKLKQAGAVNMGPSLWVLPITEGHTRVFEDIACIAAENDGQAYIMRASLLQNDDNPLIIAAFNEERNKEYGEVLEQCDVFFFEIDKEIARQNFSFAELEENEQELEKLLAWQKKIAVRDFFGASLQQEAMATLQKCQEALQGFTDKVYEYTEE